MKIIDCYLRSLQKAEENATNGGIKLDKARFIQLFNDGQDRLVRYLLKKKNEEEIRYLQKLVVYNKGLNKVRSYDVPESSLFALPVDFFAFSNVSGRFSYEECSASDFEMWEVKNENIHAILADPNNEPSYDYRESPYTIGEEGIRVYTKGFDVDELYLTYYRYPVRVDIEGYIKSDGTQSRNVDPELDDKLVSQILDIVEKQFAMNEDELNRFQIDLTNVMSPV